MVVGGYDRMDGAGTVKRQQMGHKGNICILSHFSLKGMSEDIPPLLVGKSVQRKHSSPWSCPSPPPATSVPSLATVRSSLTRTQVGRAVGVGLAMIMAPAGDVGRSCESSGGGRMDGAGVEDE